MLNLRMGVRKVFLNKKKETFLILPDDNDDGECRTLPPVSFFLCNVFSALVVHPAAPDADDESPLWLLSSMFLCFSPCVL